MTNIQNAVNGKITGPLSISMQAVPGAAAAYRIDLGAVHGSGRQQFDQQGFGAG
jgi:hypothetical protein